MQIPHWKTEDGVVHRRALYNSRYLTSLYEIGATFLFRDFPCYYRINTVFVYTDELVTCLRCLGEE